MHVQPIPPFHTNLMEQSIGWWYGFIKKEIMKNIWLFHSHCIPGVWIQKVKMMPLKKGLSKKAPVLQAGSLWFKSSTAHDKWIS
jgi:hypothetical protein